MKKKKDLISNIVLVFILIIGLSLLIYPSLSDYWNSTHQSRAIADYSSVVENMKDDENIKYWEAAEDYNKKLAGQSQRWVLTEEEKIEYESLLNITGNGVMGYVEVPKLRISLPIYHGVEESILQIAIGHIEGSSLPVGGESSHCVISGHRGLPTATLFSNLDAMVEGDVFMLRILNETLTYEVDQIRIVEPHELDDLVIAKGEDYCTLVTCTPYNVNTHRLLVRGHRIENLKDDMIVSADAVEIDTFMVALAVAIPILILLLIILLLVTRKGRTV